MAFHHSPRIVQDGLVFCMDPANVKGYVSGSTSGTDLIQDTPYSLVSAVEYQSNNAGVWNFGGTDDYISVNSLATGIEGDSPTTIAAWVLSTDTTLRQAAFNYGTNTNNRARGLEVGTPYSGTRYNICFHTHGHVYSSNNNAFTENEWHYCVVTYAGGGTNSTNIKFYINGADAGYELDFGSEGQTLNTPNSGIKLGQRYVGSDLDLLGQIGSIHMYNRVLTPAEVLQNYNALKGRFK
mgnify:CR=1 FL=1